VYEELLQRAIQNCTVLVGHHLTFTEQGEEDGNEIPSADTLLFDHDIMKAVFGNAYMTVMMLLARARTEDREMVLKGLMVEMLGDMPCSKISA
jgi:hypothetical protein